MKSYKNEDQLMAILMAPYANDKVRWRVGRAGCKGQKVWAMLLAYVDARDVRHRLDEAFGRMHWGVDYSELPNKTIIATIWGETNINNQIVRKSASDGAGGTQVEKEKGGISDAFKRAANAAFGVYEYLYEIKDAFANVSDRGKLKGQYKDGNTTKYFKYDPPNISGKAQAKQAPAPKAAPIDVLMELEKLGLDRVKCQNVIKEKKYTPEFLSEGWTSNKDSLVKFFKNQMESK